MIELQCECGTQLRLGLEWSGRRARCPQCGAVLRIPTAANPQMNRPDGPLPPPVAEEPAPLAQFDPTPAGPPSMPGGPWSDPPRAGSSPSDQRSVGERLARGPLLLFAGGGGLTVVGLVAVAIFFFLGRTQLEVVSSGDPVADGPSEPAVSGASAGDEGRRAHEVGRSEAADAGDGVDASPRSVGAGQTVDNARTPPRTGTPPPSGTPPREGTAPGDRIGEYAGRSSRSAVVTEAAGPPRQSASSTGAAARRPGAGTATPAPAGAGGNSRSNATGSRRTPTGLSGLSQTYSDFHCQRIQHQFGVVVPSSATILEVDGRVLPFSPSETLHLCRDPVLFLCRGKHQVRFHPNERMMEVEIDGHFADTYLEMREFFAADQQMRREELLRRSARTMDVHATPLLLNLLGGSYAQRDEWEAAERKFRRALQVNPLYGPAHLNLAHCLVRNGDAQGAAVELRSAEAVNVGNVFGIADGIASLRQQLEIDHEPAGTFSMDVERYVALEPLSTEDRRLVALMMALGKYAVRDEDRAKILNNLGVHFADTERPELALNYYRESLRALKTAGPERYALASTVISHMSQACEKAGFAEAEEYRWMRDAVTP